MHNTICCIQTFTCSTVIRCVETKWFSNANAISGFTLTFTNVKNTEIASLFISVCGDNFTCNNSLVGLVKNYKKIKTKKNVYYNICSYTPDYCILVA